MIFDTIQVAKREIKMGFRNSWSYSFLALFSTFSLSLLVIHSKSGVQGYSGVTGAMLHLTLYLLPLMTLFLGSFSLTIEKEEGSWALLSTYPLSTISFILGKYVGLCVVLFTIICFGYGIMGIISSLIGSVFHAHTYFLFLLFSGVLVFLFLTIALLIGCACKNKWKALTFSVFLWFFCIVGWSTILIATLSFLPYLWVKPFLIFLTFLNPAELVRLFVVVKLGGGSILGPEYFQWVDWIDCPGGSWIFSTICCAWVVIMLTVVCFIWERSRSRG